MTTSDRLSLASKAVRSGMRAYRNGNVQRMHECFAFALNEIEEARKGEHVDFGVALSRGYVRDAGKLERQEMSDQAERHAQGRAL